MEGNHKTLERFGLEDEVSAAVDGHGLDPLGRIDDVDCLAGQVRSHPERSV